MVQIVRFPRLRDGGVTIIFNNNAYGNVRRDQMKRLLERALGESGPSLIEVPVETGSEATPWEIIFPKRPKDL